jgi:hypothetical protein
MPEFIKLPISPRFRWFEDKVARLFGHLPDVTRRGRGVTGAMTQNFSRRDGRAPRVVTQAEGILYTKTSCGPSFSGHGYPTQRAAKVGRRHPRFLGARKWAPPSAPIWRSVSGSSQRGKVCTRRKLVRRGSLDPRRSVDCRSPGDAPTLGDRETVGRRERAGQETTARTSATVLATPSRFTGHWSLFPLTSFREPGTPRP